MAAIDTILTQIKQAIYGREVRQAIVDAINQCYLDAAEGITPEISTSTTELGTNVIIKVGANTSTFFIKNGIATNEQVQTYITEYLDAHPELVTTIGDGEVTYSMLASDITDIFKNLENKSGLESFSLTTEEVNGTKYLVASDNAGELCRVEIPNSEGMAFDGGYVEDSYLHLTKDGKDIEGFDPIALPAGGGGASGSRIVFAMTTSSSFSVLENSKKAEISGKFTSTDTETGVETGNGNLAIYVNSVLKENKTLEQGEFTIDVFNYLSVGSNTVKLVMTDSYGATATRTFTITVDTFSLAWNLDSTIKNEGTLVVYVTPTGAGNKTIYILVDGEIYSSSNVSTTGRRITFNVTLSEGAHVIQAYGEMTSGGVTLISDTLTCAVAQVDTNSSNVVITANLPEDVISQYTTLLIPHRVIDPNNNPATVKYLVNGSVYATEEIDQSEHVWSYRPTTTGALTLGIMCGTVTWTKELTVAGISSDIAEITDNLDLKVDASSIPILETFNYNGATLSLSENFDTHNGGLVVDDEGTRCIKVSKGDRLTINYNLFGTDARKNGANFKFIYKIENASDFNASAIQCYADNIGLKINANNAIVTSEQTSIELQTCEGCKTEFECNIEADTDNRIISLWEKGTPAKVGVYASNDNFAQVNSVGITVGSDDCDVLLYLVRIYTRDLTKEEIKANYYVDGKDADEITNRHDRNEVYDSTGRLDPDLVAAKCPGLHVLTWHASGVSTSKENKITGYVTHKYVKGGTRHTFTAANVVQKAQGTSSLGYVQAGCNEDFEFKDGFDLEDGTHIDVYSMTDESIGVNYLNFKTNVASQEHINNILINEWHNQFQPYIRPAREANSMVRDTVEGHLAVMFFHNTSDSTVDIGPYTVQPDETILYSLGCLNNSKKNFDVFAQNDTDDIFTVEVGNNISDQCRFKSDDLSTETWDGETNFEFRHISDSVTQEEAIAKWQELLTFVVSCDADSAPNTAFTTVQTINGQSFAIDSPEYRKAKWKAYAGDYFIMDSILYHQVMTLVLSQVDNRSKNTFYGYSKSKEKWHLCFAYDNDTAMGNDNEGGLTLKYGYLDTDTIGTRDVFNAADNTIFAMNRYCFADELKDMYIDRENAGAWDLDAFGDICEETQDLACESLWIEDAYRKSIDTYINLGTSAYLPMLNGKKRLQRRQFLHYQRAFMSSYFVGSYATDSTATVRGYTPSSYKGVTPQSVMKITPYCDLFVTVKAASTTIQKRALAGEEVTIELGESNMNDTEIYVRNAAFIQDLGELACLYPGYIDIAACTRLKRANVGSSVDGYSNTNMKEITVKNAKSLEYINVENCPNLVQELDLSNNVNVKECNTRGSGITGVTFANWGRVETALLNAISSIYAHNLQLVETFSLEDYSALTTVNVEGSPSIDSLALVMSAVNLSRVRLINVDWRTTVKAYDVLMKIYNVNGIDDDGHNTDNGIITGQVYFDSISETKYKTLVETLTAVVFTYGEYLEEYTVTFQNDDGTVLNVQKVERGGSAVDPITAGYISTPTKDPTVDYVYTYYKWDTAIDIILQDTVVTATYTQLPHYYTVTYVNKDGSVLERHENIEPHGSCSYEGPDLELTGYVWIGWDKKATDVVEDMTITAVYIYPALPSTIKDMSQYDYAYSDEPTDSMAYTFGEFYSILKMGRTADYFSIGTKIKLVPETDVITDTSIVFNLHSIGHYELADGTGMSKADFYMTGVLSAGKGMNTTNTNVGGWDSSNMRKWLNETLFKALPPQWRNLISASYTLASAGNQSSTITQSTDYLRIPSHAEVGFDVSAVPYKDEISSSASEVTFSQYTDNASRIKKTFNGEGAAQYWWLRSADASSAAAFRNVYNGGGSGSSNASYSCFVCAGFSV